MTGESTPGLRAVSVLPDVTGVDRQFTYLVAKPRSSEDGPAGTEKAVAGTAGAGSIRDRSVGPIDVGTIVRVNLAGRKVRAWVVADEVEVPEGVELKPIEEVVSVALDGDLMGLAKFASWRYAGRIRPFLIAGSPKRIVRERELLAASSNRNRMGKVMLSVDGTDPVVIATRAIIEGGGGVFELPPNAARLSVVEAFLEVLTNRVTGGGDLLVLVPERRDVETLARHLEARRQHCALLPDDFVKAHAGGCVVIGTRNAVFGPVGDLGGILVLDGHAEAYTDQHAPTWNSVVIARERARRAGVPFIVTSPCPPLSLTGETPAFGLSAAERHPHWPAVEVIDRRGDDPRSGLYSMTLAEIIRQALARDDRVVACVLNRTGRLRLLGCNTCGEIARCTDCGGAMRQQTRSAPGEAELLTCSICGRTRPVICAKCGGGVLKAIRVGVTRAAEELRALVGVPTRLVTGERDFSSDTDVVTGDERVVVGTEAVLHRLRAASLVVFLDFDQHLLAPRFVAAEESLALVCLAGRLVGGRGQHRGESFRRRLVIQSRLVDHVVLQAARAGDPDLVRASELERRREVNLPPFSAMALISGEETQSVVARLEVDPEIEIGAFDEIAGTKGRPSSTRYLVRANSIDVLCAKFTGLGPLGPGVRVEIDPRSI